MASNPPDYTPIYQAAGQEWNVDPALLQAVAGQEGGGVSNVSSAGAQGHMQIMPATQKALGVTNPNDVTQSIYGGAKYLSQLMDKYGDPQLAVAAYNAGPDRVDDYLAGKAPLPAETVAYVPGVTQRYQAIRQPTTAAPTSNLDQAISTLRQAPPPSAPAVAASDPFTQALTAPAQSPGVAASAAATTPVANDPFSQALAQPAAPTVPASVAPPPGAPAPVVDPAAGTGVIGNIVNLAEGAGHAVQSASRGLYGLLDKADQAVPSLNGINQAVGMNPQAALANLDAQDKAYQASGTGNTLAGMAGNLVGQATLAAPAGGLIGAGARTLGAGVNAVAPAVAAKPLARIAGYGLTGAAEGGTFGAINSDGQPIGDSALQGAIGGGVLGAAVPAVGAAAKYAAGTLTNALSSVSPEAAALAQKAQQTYGIDIRPAQIMQDGFVKTADNQLARLPGTGGAAANAEQAQQFTGAVARTIDPAATTNTIGRDFMQAQQKRIGGVLNDIETNNSVHFDQPFMDDLAKIETNAQSSLTAPEAAVVSKQIDGVLQNLKPGDTIDGETFGNLIHKGSPLDKATDNSNSNIANAAGDIKDALRSAMQRSLPPDQAKAYQDARFQYKNLMTVAPLVDGPNPGAISPAALAGRVKANFGTDRVFSPSTPLDDLAQIGQRFLKEPANSGTPDRTVVNRLIVNPVGALSGLGALGSAALTAPASTALAGAGALGAAGVGAATLGAAGRALRSPYLANRLIAGSMGGGAPQAVPNMLAGKLGLPNALTYTAGVGALANRLRNPLTSGQATP